MCLTGALMKVLRHIVDFNTPGTILSPRPRRSRFAHPSEVSQTSVVMNSSLTFYILFLRFEPTSAIGTVLENKDILQVMWSQCIEYIL